MNKELLFQYLPYMATLFIILSLIRSYKEVERRPKAEQDKEYTYMRPFMGLGLMFGVVYGFFHKDLLFHSMSIATLLGMTIGMSIPKREKHEDDE